ncbi:MAG: ASCH domain-containing protein [Myxococcota bacterium]
MSQPAVLISITPEFAGKIAAGSKTIELRRKFPDVPEGTWIYLYVTLPVGAVVGRVKVVEVDADEPSALWTRHHSEVGLTRDRFDNYFAERERGFAVRLSGYQALDAVDLEALRRDLPGFVAPQSYRFLDDEAQLVLHGTPPVQKLARK